MSSSFKDAVSVLTKIIYFCGLHFCITFMPVMHCNAVYVGSTPGFRTQLLSLLSFTLSCVSFSGVIKVVGCDKCSRLSPVPQSSGRMMLNESLHENPTPIPLSIYPSLLLSLSVSLWSSLHLTGCYIIYVQFSELTIHFNHCTYSPVFCPFLSLSFCHSCFYFSIFAWQKLYIYIAKRVQNKSNKLK